MDPTLMKKTHNIIWITFKWVDKWISSTFHVKVSKHKHTDQVFISQPIKLKLSTI
jgi:hypothetical protein